MDFWDLLSMLGYANLGMPGVESYNSLAGAAGQMQNPTSQLVDYANQVAGQSPQSQLAVNPAQIGDTYYSGDYTPLPGVQPGSVPGEGNPVIPRDATGKPCPGYATWTDPNGTPRDAYGQPCGGPGQPPCPPGQNPCQGISYQQACGGAGQPPCPPGQSALGGQDMGALGGNAQIMGLLRALMGGAGGGQQAGGGSITIGGGAPQPVIPSKQNSQQAVNKWAQFRNYLMQGMSGGKGRLF